MLGHMSVGRELYEAGAGEVGQAHLGNPVGEHLPKVETALQQRGLGKVAARLRHLAETAGAHTQWSGVAGAWNEAEAAVRSAMADVDDAHMRDPAFLAKVLTAIVYQSRHEYEEAIEDGRFTKAHEYHDSRGFMQVGRELLDKHAETFRSASADDYEALVQRYEAIMEAWPTLQPPASPALSVPELYARGSRFEFVVNRF
jgi:hypothetical protein